MAKCRRYCGACGAISPKLIHGDRSWNPGHRRRAEAAAHRGRARDPRYDSLSPQERRILGPIADGFTNRQIGAEMFLAEKTVKNYVSSLLHKLGFARRTEAAVYATALRRSDHPSPRDGSE